jgi:hypothetical protein
LTTRPSTRSSSTATTNWQPISHPHPDCNHFKLIWLILNSNSNSN